MSFIPVQSSFAPPHADKCQSGGNALSIGVSMQPTAIRGMPELTG
jgi:hypothetical protein